MCDDVCPIGSVIPDPWASHALQLQRRLQRDEWVSRTTFIGSHNSAISFPYGFGIEMDGFETLLNKTLYQNDDLGEGVDHTFSLTDQLNMGLRHLEIDITAGYFQFPPRFDDIYVCHSPVPLDPSQLAEIELAARQQARSSHIPNMATSSLPTCHLHAHLCQEHPFLHVISTRTSASSPTVHPPLPGLHTRLSHPHPRPYSHPHLHRAAQSIDLGDFDAKKLCCIGTHVKLTTMLGEVKAWLDAHPDEFVILYLDTKPLTLQTESQANAVSSDIRAVFGDSVWAASEGNVLNQSIASLLARGKRLYFEDHEDMYNKATDRIVYTPALWTQQFGDDSLAAFPDCSISGDAMGWYTPLGGIAKGLARGLYNDGSTLASDLAGHDAKRAKATECGVQVVSPNYIQPRDMAAFVWTWAAGEPSADSGCVVQRPTGRWAVLPCEQARKLPVACRADRDDAVWRVIIGACPSGYVATPPTNGFANAHLRLAANGSAALLNVSIDGLAPSPAL